MDTASHEMLNLLKTRRSVRAYKADPVPEELLDQVLEHMDDEILNAQLKAMMDEKQALQEQIAAAEQSQTHNAAQKSRMAELREWMAKLEVNQQYSDEQVRMAVERITVVDAETIRFRYPGAELEKKL